MVETMIALPIFVIGPVAIARIITAPFIDALGRRRRWTAILITMLLVLAAVIVALAPAANPIGATVGPVEFVLMLAAMLVAGAVLAAVDGLRSLVAPQRAQGGLAAAQYLGTVVPAAWLYGVFVCPIADFFRRYRGLAWAILAVLVVGDLATHVDTSELLRINAGLLTSADVSRIGTIRSVAQFGGAIFAAWLVWEMGATRGLAATFLLAAAAALSGLAAVAAAPSYAWFLTALAVGAIAQGAILVGFVAFIARVVAPAYAAWQFTLLWLAGLPTGVIVALRNAGNERLGSSGTYVAFLVLLAISILFTRWVARRLDARHEQQ
jgi:hypothetical protein